MLLEKQNLWVIENHHYEQKNAQLYNDMHTHTFSPENSRHDGITKASSRNTHYFGINASVIPDVSPDSNSDCCNEDCMFDYLDTCHA